MRHEGRSDIEIISFIFDDTRLGLSCEVYQNPEMREM